MGSIKKRIALTTAVLVAVFVLIVGITSGVLSYLASNDQVSLTMAGTIKVTADRISKELEAYGNIAAAAGCLPAVADPEVELTEKEHVIEHWSKEYGFQRGNLLDSAGRSLFDGNNYADRVYFHEAMAGKIYISTPVRSKITGELTIMVAAPIWEEGEPGGKVIGVVYFVPNETFLNDIMKSIKISDNSSAYMIDSNGYTIADVAIENIAVENIEKNAETDPDFRSLAAVHKLMREGETGVSRYKLAGVSKTIAFAPVSGTDGWSVAIIAPNSDFQAATRQAILVTILLIGAALLISLVLSMREGKKIAAPIRACAERLNLLAEGDMHSEVPEIKTNDETGVLANSTRIIVDTLNALVDDEHQLLGEMASGNFDVSPNEDIYIGDLHMISDDINNINDKLSGTMSEIGSSAAQVALGADQVAAGAQSLSEGSITQAASIQELAATINQISQEMQETSNAAENAKNIALDAGVSMAESNNKMQELSEAMQEISQASQEIGKIIKTIEDIAFQTNILALNAAVEAARAGAAGKGFAVVADEVRNLASKSSEASKDTAVLIEHSMHSIEMGTRLAFETKDAMDVTAESAKQAVELMGSISDMVTNQAISANQITAGIDQISSVIQTNSATAEESAATSEELSGQAEVMKQMMDSFNLKK